MISERSIVKCILLTLVTCGIYGIFWFIWLTDDANAISGTDGTSGAMSYLLAFVTCNIYTFFWAFRQGEKIELAKQRHGMPSSDSSVLYLVLCILGLNIVALALMQNELNKLATPGY